MKPNKKLGQNFLINPDIAKRFVESTNPQPNDTYLEIGPGKGAITSILLSYKVSIIAVDIDSNMTNHLKENFDVSRLTVVNQNILDLDINQIINKPYKVIGALPYNISKKIIKKIITENNNKPISATFIIQKEVAEKYTATPPKATFLSNYINNYAICDKLFDITRENFNPIPKVTSSVIQIKPKKTKQDIDLIKFTKFTKHLFNNPRKTALNNLKSLIPKEKRNFSQNHPQLIELLSKRPGQLTPSELQELFMMYNDLINHEEQTKHTTSIPSSN